MTHAIANIVFLAVLVLATGIIGAELELNGGLILDALRGRFMR